MLSEPETAFVKGREASHIRRLFPTSAANADRRAIAIAERAADYEMLRRFAEKRFAPQHDWTFFKMKFFVTDATDA